MQYLLLIFRDDKVDQERDEAGMQEFMESYYAFIQEITESGHNRGGVALQDTHTASCARVVDGETVTSDGPFAETKKQLGGYYLIEASDLDEAIRVAAKIPHASNGTIEVRPVVDLPQTI